MVEAAFCIVSYSHVLTTVKTRKYRCTQTANDFQGSPELHQDCNFILTNVSSIRIEAEKFQYGFLTLLPVEYSLSGFYGNQSHSIVKTPTQP